MKVLVDSGFLYALVDADDSFHKSVSSVAQQHQTATLIVPISVLPEVLYLLASRLGHPTMRRFLHEFTNWDVQLETLDKTDLKRVVEILEQYADAKLDFVDATIIAIAEKLNITRVFTVDRRDFSIVRPRHCQAFQLFP